ncbi:MAG: dienelactone hydrolase [bacterium]|nr:dienelactone hydrolase [Deltaproteobacteria bacterium]MCP4908703.1 dienelactone hydrolase [bacterium]
MLDRYDETDFEHDGLCRRVFVRGEGPGIVVMHEIPGIYDAVIEFADRLVADGYRVYLPDLIGEAGRPFSNGYVLSSMARACIAREFHVLATRASSPITDWLRALARQAHAECGGPGVGCIGMCLTGNFGLAMMVDEAVMAPVLSQPSLPFPFGAKRKAALHISDEELAIIKERVAKRGCKVLGLRFTGDPMCPPERFETLRTELGEGFEGIEIDSSKGNPHGNPTSAHSVVTKDLIDDAGHPTREALDRVMSFFAERLRVS